MDVSTKRAVGTGLMSVGMARFKALVQGTNRHQRAGRVCLDTIWGERDILRWMEEEGEVRLEAARLARSVNYS